MASSTKRAGSAKRGAVKAGKTAAPGKTKAADRRPAWRRVAKPDALDPRDRAYAPNVAACPSLTLFPKVALPVKNQGTTNACTGFGLSLVVEHLLRAAGREDAASISPFMLYSMARRYDEFPGSVEDDGSSLRGALKGWFKHGACAFEPVPQPRDAAGAEDDRARLVVRRGAPSARRVLPHRPEAHHRHALGAARGRHPLRELRLPRRLGRRRRPDAAWRSGRPRSRTSGRFRSRAAPRRIRGTHSRSSATTSTAS